MTLVTAPSQGANQIARESNSSATKQNLSGMPHETRDVLKMFEANLVRLEDLAAQMGHLLTDVRSVIRR